jgi:pimeloyl-ACP methyl ester carboxylesterase
MKNVRLAYRSSEIHYVTSGNGPRLLLCFHGYGRNALSFAFLFPYLQQEYKIVAVDMPFHGQTSWREGKYFTPTHLAELVAAILQHEHHKTAYSVMGFSMGGRVVLRLFQQYPDVIDRLALVAPDGLFVNKWYWLATQTSIGNRMFRYTTESPTLLRRIADTGKRIKQINPGIYKFVDYYIGDRQVRQELYERWTGFSKISPDTASIVKAANDYKVPLRMLYGRYDRIIRHIHGERLCSQINDCKIDIADTGHHLLQPEHTRRILQLLKD